MTGYDDDLENQDTQFDDIETEAFEDDTGNDSFADTEELGDDLSAEDVWDEDQAADAEAEEQTQPKKKSSFVTFLIIGVVVLAGLGFIFMQFSGGGSAPVETAADETAAQDANSLANLRDQTSLEQQQLAPVATEETAEATPPAPQGFMNTEPTQAETPAAPTPALPESPTMTAVEAPPAVVPPGETLPTAPAPETAAAEPAPVVLEAPKAVSDFPSVDQIKKAPSLEDAPVVSPAETVATPAAPGIDPALVAETQGKLDEANSRIAALEQQLAAEKDKATGAISDATGKAQEREQALKAQLEELQKKLAASERVAAAKSQPVVSPEPVAESEPEPVKPVKESAAIEDKPLSPAPAVTAAAKQVAWELRGAQPGQALLSRKGGEGDIRTVNVGDSLPGLGKIVSIDQSAKGWVVKGTLATVTQ